MPTKIIARTKVFEDAHVEFEKGMNTYTSFKIASPALCEDLVQDTFIKTWNYMDKGGEIIKMKAFLYRILNGLIIDEYRKHKAISLDVLAAGGFEARTQRGNISLTNHIDGGIAFSLIAKLPPLYRKIIKMKFIDNLSITEIAQKTDETNNAVTVQLHRGMIKLRELYFHTK